MSSLPKADSFDRELYDHFHNTPYRIVQPILPWSEEQKLELLAHVEHVFVSGYRSSRTDRATPLPPLVSTERTLAQPRRRKFPNGGPSPKSSVGGMMDDDGDVRMASSETEPVQYIGGTAMEDLQGASRIISGHAREEDKASTSLLHRIDPWTSIFRKTGTLKSSSGVVVANRTASPKDGNHYCDGDDGNDLEEEEEEGQDLPPEYQSSQRGKPCGHVFQIGEGVYWCRECAMDQTCVLCYRCFHATNHEGHETSFSISQKAGGCCDCGDVEAWRRELKCQFHSAQEQETPDASRPLPENASSEIIEFIPVPEALIRSMRTTIATVLDFVLDTLSASPTDFSVPSTVDTVLRANPPETQEERNIVATAAERGGGLPHACILWNDELHSFTEVINRIASSTRCTVASAEILADNVDQVGRDVVYVSTSIPRLITIAKSIAAAGIAVTIRTCRETLREILAGHLILWLKDLVKRVHGERRIRIGMKNSREPRRILLYESLVVVVRRLLCEELAAPRRRVREMIVGRRDDVDVFKETSQLSERRLRIDYLLSFDARLWKSLRGALRELYISTMIVGGEDFKKVLGIRFAMNYLLTANSYLILDREWDISIINFSVQLYTVATIASHLVVKTQLLETIFSVLKSVFLTEVFPRQFQLGRFFSSFRLAHAVNLPHYSKLNCEGSLVYEKPRYMHLFYDIRYLITANRVASELFRRGDQSAFIKFLDLCCVSQGMNPQKRELRDHVQYETKGWINCFNLSLNLGRAIEYVGEAFAPTTRPRCVADFEDFRRAFKKALRAVDLWCTFEHMSECAFLEEILAAMAASSTPGANSARPRAPPDGFRVSEYRAGLRFRIMEYRVLMRPVSLHNPLLWMLSMLLTHVPFYFGEMERMGREISLWDLFEFKEEESAEETSNWWVPVGEAIAVDGGLITVAPVEALPTSAAMIMGEEDEEQYGGCLLIPDADDDRTNGRVKLSKEDRVARFMDYILRAEVLLAQIRAGIWVRNGQMMRDQAMYFKYLSLRDLYDHGLFILQVGATLLGPDRFLTTVMERFELSLWFSGRILEAMKHSHLEASVLESLAEEMLCLLLFVMTERARPAGMNVESQIRRELVHLLALHPGDYRIRNLLRPNFGCGDAYGLSAGCRGIDEVLPELATFKFPDGTNDTGLYVLKERCFDEVDPWFWHYNPTQRAEIEGILAKRSEGSRGGGERGSLEAMLAYAAVMLGATEPALEGLEVWEEVAREAMRVGGGEAGRVHDDGVAAKLGVRRPQLQKLAKRSGFGDLNNVVRGTVVTKTGSFTPVNDRIMAAALQLLLVAVESELVRRIDDEEDEASFLHTVGTVKVEFQEVGGAIHSFNVVDLACNLLARCYVEDALREYGGGDAKKSIVAGAAKMRAVLVAQRKEEADKNEAVGSNRGGDGNAKADAAAKRKVAAKERQAAIMAQFAVQQKSFMEKYRNDEDFIHENNMEVDEGGPSEKEEAGHKDIADSGINAPGEIDQEPRRAWHPPSGNCIVCQEELASNGQSQYGMLGLIQTCYITRSRRLDLTSSTSIVAALAVGMSLDQEQERPLLQTSASQQQESTESRKQPTTTTPQVSRMSPPLARKSEPGSLFVSTCGHLMHFACYDLYKTSVERRQVSQEYRSHPENLDRYEFLCPLCKTLGNCIVPILEGRKVERENLEAERPKAGLEEWWEKKGKGVVAGMLKSLDEAAKTPLTAFEASSSLTNEIGTSADATTPSATERSTTAGGGNMGGMLSNIIATLTSDILNRSRTVGEVGARAAAERESMRIAMAAANAGAGNVATGRRDDRTQGIILKLIPTLHSLRRSLGGEGGPPDEPGPRWFDFMAMLSSAVATTVCGVERRYRGTRGASHGTLEKKRGVGLIDQTSDLSLTLLRVLSTATLAFGSVIGDGWMSTEIVLRKDPFSVLVDISFLDGTRDLTPNGDVFMVVRVLWYAEVVRSLVAIGEAVASKPGGSVWEVWRTATGRMGKDDGDVDMKGDATRWYSAEERGGFIEFLKWVLTETGFTSLENSACVDGMDVGVKSVLHLHGRYCIIPEEDVTDEDRDDDKDYVAKPVLPETERLRDYLSLPSITDICSNDTLQSPFLSNMIRGWLAEAVVPMRTSLTLNSTTTSTSVDPTVMGDPTVFDETRYLTSLIQLETPAIYELVSLPRQLEVLFEECFRKTCSRCKRIIANPALCLICGALMCSQSVCCSQDRLGECNLHMKTCGGDVGIFFLVKTFRILFLNHEKGTYMEPPYLDSYGEVDLNLRKGRLQYLHVKRYDEVRRIWLSHGIPGHVARGIDSIGSLGLWTTF
ncbi:hypothetical protein BC829DRAFT_488840 [Chytridium lagenaria]|nr:hypothetical protein BC829DRAFT_488840 [Chytridium lagenaria]